MKKITLTTVLISLLVISACGSPTGDVTYEEDERLEKCSSNIYNCENFKTRQEAQRLYELCGGISNDVHHLDRDLDGLACETLP